jgi:hypothetical protein
LVDPCDHNKKPLGSLKGTWFIDQLSFSRMVGYVSLAGNKSHWKCNKMFRDKKN